MSDLKAIVTDLRAAAQADLFTDAPECATAVAKARAAILSGADAITGLFGVAEVQLYSVRAGDEINNADLFVWAVDAEGAVALWRQYYECEPEAQPVDVFALPAWRAGPPAALPWHERGGVVSALPPVEERLAARGARQLDNGRWVTDTAAQARRESPAEFLARL